VPALYGSGRRAAALEVYQALRRRMTDDLGIPPSPSTTTLHHVMLQDRPDQRYLSAAGAGAMLWSGAAAQPLRVFEGGCPYRSR
jgi:SARP family transcriptional regulator, regulator of embCAB operon